MQATVKQPFFFRFNFDERSYGSRRGRLTVGGQRRASESLKVQQAYYTCGVSGLREIKFLSVVGIVTTLGSLNKFYGYVYVIK